MQKKPHKITHFLEKKIGICSSFSKASVTFLKCLHLFLITPLPDGGDVAYPGVVFNRTPSRGIAARGGQTQRSGEEGPPELLLPPSGLLWLWV